MRRTGVTGAHPEEPRWVAGRDAAWTIRAAETHPNTSSCSKDWFRDLATIGGSTAGRHHRPTWLDVAAFRDGGFHHPRRRSNLGPAPCSCALGSWALLGFALMKRATPLGLHFKGRTRFQRKTPSIRSKDFAGAAMGSSEHASPAGRTSKPSGATQPVERDTNPRTAG